MNRITIDTIPHTLQRYETVGNYFEEAGVTFFEVSEMNNGDYEFLVALHEVIEYFLVKKSGIRLEDVDAFDLAFENERVNGVAQGEPGDDTRAPYYFQHQVATGIERVVAALLGVDWNAYSEAVDTLSKHETT